MPKKTVIPRTDDCISLLLHTDDAYCPNRNISPDAPRQMLFGSYRSLDSIDTGLTDCYSEEYVIEAQKIADALNATLDYVPGGIRLLENLVAGQWDEQFIIAQPARRSDIEISFSWSIYGLSEDYARSYADFKTVPLAMEYRKRRL